ncbi:alpha/beta fold hydrolase [Sphingomonas sp. UYP23]
MTHGNDKAPVLLVHGLIGSLLDLLPAFASCNVTAYAPDLIGYGAHRAARPEDISLPAQVAHLLSCLILIASIAFTWSGIPSVVQLP